MGSMLISRALPLAVAVLGGLALGHWVVLPPKPTVDLSLRVPGMDGPSTRPALAATDLRGTFTAGEGKAQDLPGAWPCFRGAKLDAISTEEVPLARQWKADGPIKLWQIELGEGFAAPVIVKGRVYVLDYDVASRADVLRCLSLQDGKEIWRRAYAVDISRNHGFSRTVPSATEKHVLTLGPMCHVLCVDAATGDFKWGIDLVREYGTKVPLWYAGQCPLIDGDRAILAPGGSSLLIAVDLETGKVVWKTPNPRKWKMTHASVTPVTFKGKRMYVYPASDGVVAVSAEDGSVLWELPEWKPSTNVPAPLPIGENRLLLSGQVSGSMMVELVEEGGKITPKILYRRSPDVFGSDQQTPVYYKGYIYGVVPRTKTGNLVCLSVEGKPMWASGGEHPFGLGPYMAADGMLIVLEEKGTLRLVEATEKEFKSIAEAKVFEKGRDCWGPLALAGGRLLARDMTRLVCLDLRRASYE